GSRRGAPRTGRTRGSRARRGAPRRAARSSARRARAARRAPPRARPGGSPGRPRRRPARAGGRRCARRPESNTEPAMLRPAQARRGVPMDEKKLEQLVAALRFVSEAGRDMSIDEIATIQPGLGRIMPEIGARTWKLYYAAEARHWPTAMA